SILKDIPGYIVHGRYDMICPLEQAYALHKAWAKADFFVVQGAGHSASEPGISAALIEASDGMLKKLGNEG
ncbi:MAG: alpha/beta hydrolase, partial [Thiotrichaceae bacterium]|nr:alpha/beta hydrolase [Thiotrichaceae bacterium]